MPFEQVALDIWDKAFDGYYRVIPVSGSVDKLGKARFTSDVAKKAVELTPMLPYLFGLQLAGWGLRVCLMSELILFPIRYADHQKVSLPLVERSCQQLKELLADREVELVFPNVDWPEIGTVLENYLGYLAGSMLIAVGLAEREIEGET